MIPNVFVSSTIKDLQYLREALRDAIHELAYNAVMSEYGEVGYIQPTTAADACVRTVERCQLIVLIVGKRYGDVSNGGYSVTHREFLAARDAGIPTVTFVEAQVLNYKEVYDTDPSAEIWNDFTPMDRPHKTFKFLEEIRESKNYNAILPFSSVANAKALLKRQIADFVGDLLSETLQPARRDLKEVLAEIKTLRSQLTTGSAELQAGKEEAQRRLQALRFLLEDKHQDYRSFVARIFGDLDKALPHLPHSKTFDEVVTHADIRQTVVGNDELSFGGFGRHEQEGAPEMLYGSYGLEGAYELFADRTIKISRSLSQRFSTIQELLINRIEELKN